MLEYYDMVQDGVVDMFDYIQMANHLANITGYENLVSIKQWNKTIGDVINDGKVDEEDVNYLMWFTFLLDNYPIVEGVFTDFNLDGETNSDDVVILNYYVLGLVNDLFLDTIPEKKYGDLNFDGVWTVDDLVILRNHVNGTVTLSEAVKALGIADLNGDGSINEEDVTLLKNFLNGEDVTFTVAA